MPKKKKPSSGKYGGILKEPIIIPAVIPFNDQSDGDDYIQKQYYKKIEALYEHYDVKPDSSGAAHSLIMRMAFDHIPGFQLRVITPKKVGRPPEWKTVAGVKLYIDVQRRVNEGKSILGACKELCLEDHYQECKPGSLNTRFHEIKKNVEEHNPQLEVLAGLLPSYLPESLWTSTAPDGTSLFQNPKIVQGFVDMLSQPTIQK